jgi:hypothetical protein
MSDLEVDEPQLRDSAADCLEPNWDKRKPRIFGVRRGVLVGMKGEGRTPMVTFTGQCGSAAVAAQATIDLHGSHIGREVVLMFEGGDPTLPIVLGCIRSNDRAGNIDQSPGQVEVDADGERLQVTAKEQLVLRCGKATITLTKTGKVLIQGTYISSRSSGVNRIKGGSVQLN